MVALRPGVALCYDLREARNPRERSDYPAQRGSELREHASVASALS